MTFFFSQMSTSKIMRATTHQTTSGSGGWTFDVEYGDAFVVESPVKMSLGD